MADPLPSKIGEKRLELSQICVLIMYVSNGWLNLEKMQNVKMFHLPKGSKNANPIRPENTVKINNGDITLNIFFYTFLAEFQLQYIIFLFDYKYSLDTKTSYSYTYGMAARQLTLHCQ